MGALCRTGFSFPLDTTRRRNIREITGTGPYTVTTRKLPDGVTFTTGQAQTVLAGEAVVPPPLEVTQ